MNDPLRQVHLLGVFLNPLTIGQAVEQCVDWCRGGTGTRTVVTLNAAAIAAMRSDQDLRAACKGADLALGDGASMVLAARVAGERIPERVTGIDLMQRVVERAADEALSLFFLGATPLALDRMIRFYQKRYPGLRVAGFQHGFFDRSEQTALISQIRTSGADILFIGMPTPWKEVWAHQFRNSLGVSLIIGVGGSFDVVAGLIPRAPVWMQRTGLEWSWRLLCEPRRLWKRYLFGNSYFIFLMAGLAIRRLMRRKG